MKKLLLVLLLMPVVCFAKNQYLHYKFNENVVITISNVKCPIEQLTNEYPYAAIASRIDNQHLFGCYTHKNDDIVIQWAGGDKTILPDNAFLMGDGNDSERF